MTAIHAQLIDVVGVFQERQGHTLDAMPDTTSWLAARSNLARPTARHEAEIATRAPAIPALMQAWRHGRISWDQLLVLAPVATPETDAELAEQAPGWTFHSTVVNARALKPVTAKEALEQHRERFVHIVRRRDATLQLRGRLSGDQAAIVEAALNRLADSLPEEGRLDGGEPARRGARMADALVTMCEAHPEVMAQNPARPLVVIHIDAEPFTGDGADCHGTSTGADPATGDGHCNGGATLAGHQPTDCRDGTDGGGASTGTGPGTSNRATGSQRARTTTIGSGWAITNDTARRLACDCRWQIVADDPDGRTVGISRESRRIPPGSPASSPAATSIGADGLAATAPSGSNTIMSFIGPTADQPTRTISSPCAGITTTCSTKVAGPWQSIMRRPISPSPVPMAGPTPRPPNQISSPNTPEHGSPNSPIHHNPEQADSRQSPARAQTTREP